MCVRGKLLLMAEKKKKKTTMTADLYVSSAPEFISLTLFAYVQGLLCNSMDSITYVMLIDNPSVVTAIKVNNIESAFLFPLFFF